MNRSHRRGFHVPRSALVAVLPLAALTLHCAPEDRELAALQRGLSITLTDCLPASLVTALTNANAAGAGPHTIALKGGCTYSLTAPDNFWYGPTGLPPIASDITIEGNGAVIERDAAASASFRLLFVAGPPTPTPDVGGTRGLNPGKLTLHNLTLRGGLARGGKGGSCRESGGGGAGLGGAIFAQGSVTLSAVTLTGNQAEGGGGGNGSGTYTNITPGGGGGLGGDGGIDRGGGGGFKENGVDSGGTGGGFLGGEGGSGMTGGTGMGAEPGLSGRLKSGVGGGGRGLGGVGARAAASSADGGGGGYPFAGVYRGGGGAGFGGAGGSSDNSSSGSGGGFGGGGAGGTNGFGGGGVGGGGGAGSVSGGGGGGGFGGGGGGYEGGNGGFGGGGGSARQGTTFAGGAGGFGGGAGGTSGGTPIGGGAGAGLGGAVFLMYGSLTAGNSTFANNTALGGTGGTSSGTAAVAGGNGKGLGAAVFSLNGTLALYNTTIAHNIVKAGGTDSGSAIGAVYSLAYGNAFGGQMNSAAVTLQNSILAGTSDGTQAVSDLVNDQRSSGTATVTATTPNIVVSLNNVADQGTVNGSGIRTMDPMLGTLVDNGGSASTLLPPACSAALYGDPALCTAAPVGGLDQRGQQRPAAFCTLGAIEAASMLCPLGTPCAVARQCASNTCSAGLCADAPSMPADPGAAATSGCELGAATTRHTDLGGLAGLLACALLARRVRLRRRPSR